MLTGFSQQEDVAAKQDRQVRALRGIEAVGLATLAIFEVDVALY